MPNPRKITKRKFQYIVDNINKMNAKRLAADVGVSLQHLHAIRAKFFNKKYTRNRKRFKGPPVQE